MEPVEASAKSTDPEEVIDLQDDHLMHRDDEAQPEPEQVQDEVLTNDIEKDPPPVKAKRRGARHSRKHLRRRRRH